MDGEKTKEEERELIVDVDASGSGKLGNSLYIFM